MNCCGTVDPSSERRMAEKERPLLFGELRPRGMVGRAPEGGARIMVVADSRARTRARTRECVG